jgi:2'-5' RNA ligase
VGDATQTAVIVAVSEAEPAVREPRARLDRAAGWGVPAHVTVLFPFVAPAAVDDALVRRLAAAVATVPAFECSFAGCGWFDEDVLWLAPQPDEPFRALTTAVWSAFPDHPPYEGEYDDLQPHLTVAQRGDGGVAELREIEAVVVPRLPITTRVDRVSLIAGSQDPDSWSVVAMLPLG